MNNGEVRSVCIIYYIQTELPRHCSKVNNGEMRSVCIIYYIQTELPRRCSEMNNGVARFVCIIYYTQTELPRHCSEMNNGEIWSVCTIYDIQTELPRHCSEMNNWARLGPSVLYTIYRPSYSAVVREWATGGAKSVCIIYYTQTTPAAVVRKWTTVRWGPSILFTIMMRVELPHHCSPMMTNGEIWSVCIYCNIQTELPRRCPEMNNGEMRSVSIIYCIQTE